MTKTPAKDHLFSALVANITGKTRRQTLDGVEYLIAPVVMIRQQVLSGSEGPLFYPLEEITLNFSAWNGMPLMDGHPFSNGHPVSAKDAGLIEKSGLGVVKNSKVDGKLEAEAWFDVEKTRRIRVEILHALNEGKPIEVSTGLFTRSERAPEGANHEGTPYDFIARDYQPDHLAVLINETGACSLEDGCGILANRAVTNPLSKLTPNTEETVMPLTANQKKKMVDGLIKGASCKGTFSEDDRPTLNEMSDEEITELDATRQKLTANHNVAAAAKKGFTDPGGNEHNWDEKTQTWNAKMKDKSKNAQDGDEEDEDEDETELFKKKNKGKKAPATNVLTPDQEEAIAFANSVKQERRDEAIGTIKANEANQLSDAQLKALPLDALQAVANSIPKKEEDAEETPTANYFGAGAPPTAAPTFNKDEDLLPLPTSDDYAPAK
jgi:hypothetical protein